MIFVSQSKSEAAILRRIFQGEPEAYRFIVEKYQPLVYAVALAQTGSVALADKVVVETFEEGYGRLVSLTDPRKLGLLLCSIAQQASEQLLLHRVPNWNKPRVREEAGAPVDLQWVQTELIEPLNEELGSFTSREKQGLLLHAFCGFNAKQIAALLKIEKKEAAEDLARTRENVEKALLKEVVKGLHLEVNNKERLLYIVSRLGGSEVAAKVAQETRIGKPRLKIVPVLLTGVVLLVLGISALFIYRVVNRIRGPEENQSSSTAPATEAEPESPDQQEGEKPALELPMNYAIKGRVVDERFLTDGVAGVTVEAAGKQTETDFYGAFEIRGVARGEHDITVRVGDRIIRQNIRFHTEKDNAPITIRLDDSIPARFHFRGRVFDRQTGSPITTFEVASCKDFPEMMQPYVIKKHFREQQHPEGMVHERFVTLGNYTVYVRAKGYAPFPVHFSIDENWDGQQVFELPLYRATGLKGTVYGSNELSLGGAAIIPRQGTASGLAMDVIDYGRTNSMGRFELYTLPVGIQSFLITHQQGVARAIVELEPGKIKEIKIQFPRKGALTGDITLHKRPVKFRDFRRQVGGSMIDLAKNLNYISPGQYEVLLTPEPVVILASVEPTEGVQWFYRGMKQEVSISTTEPTWLDFNFEKGSGVLQGSATLANTQNRFVYAEVVSNRENGTEHHYYYLGGPGGFQLGDLPLGSGELTLYAAARQVDISDFDAARVLMDKQTKPFNLDDSQKFAYLDFAL